MIFVDTWAWVALALKRDQNHRRVKAQHKTFQRARRTYVTTDFVLSELIAHLYTTLTADQAQRFINNLLASADDGTYQFRHTSPRSSAEHGTCAKNITTSRTSPSSISPRWSSCRTSASRTSSRATRISSK